VRRFSSAFIARFDDLVACDRRDWQIADVFDDVQKDVIALPSRRGREILLPSRSLAIASEVIPLCE
jgi:hypothetical protein